MIKKVIIQNFKSLKNVKLSLSNLNVLSGLNGSGKSSFIQTLLLLRQSFINKDHNGEDMGLILQDRELISLGSGKDVFYQYAGNDEKIVFEIQSNGIYFWSFNYDSESDILPLNEKKYSAQLSSCNLFNRNFQYLNAEHISPQISYQRSEFQVIRNKNIGIKGEYVVHYLSEYGLSEKIESSGLQHPKAVTNSLIHQADAWIGEVSPGAKLIAENIKGLNLVSLKIKFETNIGYTNEFKPVNTGFGISYVLPVIIAILKAKKGDILILENPEAHLHPKGQSTIGKMMACAAQEGVNIFVETHSDHIINGIRVSVKEGNLSKSGVKFFYFDRILDKDQQYSDVKEILIDKNGEFSDYPENFLDEWNVQLMKLI